MVKKLKTKMCFRRVSETLEMPDTLLQNRHSNLESTLRKIGMPTKQTIPNFLQNIEIKLAI